MKQKHFFKGGISLVLALTLIITSCSDTEVAPKETALKLNAPTDGSTTGLTPTLKWEKDNDIIFYDVYLGEVNPPTDRITRGTDIETPEYTVKDKLKPETTYYWYIDPSGSAIHSPSKVYKFTTASRLKLLQPAINESVELTPQVELVWEEVKDAEKYEVYLSEVDSPLRLYSTQLQSSYPSVTTHLNLKPGTTYQWKVDPVGSNTRVESEVYYFTTKP